MSISIKLAGRLTKVSQVAPQAKVLTVTFRIMPRMEGQDRNIIMAILSPNNVLNEIKQSIDPNIETALKQMANSKYAPRYYSLEDWLYATGIKAYFESTHSDHFNINDEWSAEEFFDKRGLGDVDSPEGQILSPIVFAKLSVEVI